MNNSIYINDKNQFKRKFLFLFLLIFIPRLIYILLFDNLSSDSFFYLDIAENISKGCGFSFTNSSGNCELVFGGYFPGYPVFIYLLKNLGLNTKSILLLVSLLQTSSIIYLLNTLIDVGLKGKKLFAFTLLISLSPLSIGFSRFLLIEPILYIFSILIITELIKLKINQKCFVNISARIFTFIVLSIYFKPTSIILIIPYFFIVIVNNGLKKFLQTFISFFLVVSISIIPWAIRDLNLGANLPFRGYSNVIGKNVSGLNYWLSSFSLTEYDNASVLYPINDRKDGKRNNIKIKTKYNPFISSKDSDYIEVNKIISKDNPEIIRGFTDEENEIFVNFAKERFKNNGILGNFILFSLKSFSLILHPLNSWGFPISVGRIHSKVDIIDISQASSIFFKLFLFGYRVIIFWNFFSDIFSLLRELNPSKILSKKNYYILKENSFLVASLLILASNIFLYVGIFGLLEHRYFYQIMPWIEILIFLRLFNAKKLI